MGAAELLEAEEVKGDVTEGKDNVVVIEEGQRQIGNRGHNHQGRQEGRCGHVGGVQHGRGENLVKDEAGKEGAAGAALG